VGERNVAGDMVEDVAVVGPEPDSLGQSNTVTAPHQRAESATSYVMRIYTT
jgi:hypothetical protein